MTALCQICKFTKEEIADLTNVFKRNRDNFCIDVCCVATKASAGVGRKGCSAACVF